MIFKAVGRAFPPRVRGVLLSAALVVAMFSILAATVVIKLSKQSMSLTKSSEASQQQRLQARAETNRVLAKLAEGITATDFEEHKRAPQVDGDYTWRSWIEADPDHPALAHVRAEVWKTEEGPPGESYSRVIRLKPAIKEVQFVQTADPFLGIFKLHYREEGKSRWNVAPPPAPLPSGFARAYYNMEADDSGGLFLVDLDLETQPPFNLETNFRRFDSASGTWRDLSLPPNKTLKSLSHHKGRVYALTASSPTSRFDQISVYDVASDSWSGIPDPPNSVYDRSGRLRASPGRAQALELDVDTDGTLYFRPDVVPGMESFHHNTTVHKWDGRTWSTLPAVPDSLLPDLRVGATAAQFTPPGFEYNFKQMTATGAKSIAMLWSQVDAKKSESVLLEFDGEVWSKKTLPTIGNLYSEGEGYTNVLTGEVRPTEQEEEAHYLTNLTSDTDGELYLGSEQNIVSAEDGAYSRLDLPESSGPAYTFGTTIGSVPVDEDNKIETIVSF